MGCQCTTPVNNSKSKGHSIEDRSSRYKTDSTSGTIPEGAKDFSKPKKMAQKMLNNDKKPKIARKQLPKEFYLE